MGRRSRLMLVCRFYDAVGPMLGLLMAMCLVFPLSMLVRCVECNMHTLIVQDT